MSRDSGPSINSLVRDWRKGVPRTTGHLKDLGYSYQLLNRYEQSGWIESLGKGAYVRAGDNVTWSGALYTLQTEASLPLRLGGISSLSYYGYGQYLQATDRLYLFGITKKRLPPRFLPLLEQHGMVIEPGGALGTYPLPKLSSLTYGDISVYGSPPELAYVEMLMQVPITISFQEAAEVTEGLNSLRAEYLRPILETSASVKANRLALYFGDRYSHPWRSKMMDEKIELGKGKRTIVPGGKLNARYQIVVPEEEDVF